MSIGSNTNKEEASVDEDEWVSRYEGVTVIMDASEQEVDVNDAIGGDHRNSDAVLARSTRQDSVAGGMELAVLGDTCPICLQGLNDAVMIQQCYHVYCFECLSMWVHNLALHGVDPATCPLCKVQFQTIYTDVVSETEYELFQFRSRPITDDSTTSTIRQRERRARNDQGFQRRSLVYRRHMRLAKVNDIPVPAGTDPNYPSMIKVKGEYDAWMERELRACIGREVDLTVLITIINCCLDKISRCGTKKCYEELQTALEPFLFEDAAVFARELAYFLNSRLNMEAYDAVIEYCCSNAAECKTGLCGNEHHY